MIEPCGVVGCPSLADGEDGFCSVHRVAKRAAHVMAGTKCTRCHRLLENGEFITRDSTLEAMTHAVCPPPRPYVGRKKDRPKPLLDDAIASSCKQEA